MWNLRISAKKYWSYGYLGEPTVFLHNSREYIITCPFTIILPVQVMHMIPVKTKARLQTHFNFTLDCLALTDVTVLLWD